MEKILGKLEAVLRKQISRRTFFKGLSSALLFYLAGNGFLKSAFAKEAHSTGRTPRSVEGAYDLVVAEGMDPFRNTVEAIKTLGGMERFVKKGDVVVVKPNMAWDRSPEQAANTHPDVVAALVEMVFQAGAKRVNVFDVPCNDERRVHENSGIAKAAKEKGANVFFVDHWNVVKAKFSYQSGMADWPILRDAIDCDVFINVPVLKHHSLAGLTLSMKNLMGVCSGTRGLMHVDMENKLVDLSKFISPELTVIDATRVLLRHGPSGGNLEDVKTMNKVFAGTDPTLADSYAAHLFGIEALSLPHLKVAADKGYGKLDFQSANIKTLAI